VEVDSALEMSQTEYGRRSSLQRELGRTWKLVKQAKRATQNPEAKVVRCSLICEIQTMIPARDNQLARSTRGEKAYQK
jgi:hypothetical protein